MDSKIGNILIYLGFRFGILAVVVAFLILLSNVALEDLSSQQGWLWITGLLIGGCVSAYTSKIIWNRRYHAGQTVPCLFCSGEFTNEALLSSPALSDKHQEVQCPHCKKMNSY